MIILYIFSSVASFVRSVTYSFGSICLGSLIVAIIQALRDMCRSMRENDDGILFCLAECILGCIESIIEYFNEWAYAYVGIYGYSFIDAAKGVFSLFKSRGWTTIITDSLIGNVLGMISVGVGVLTGILGALVAHANGMNIEIGGFVFGFIIGFALTQVLMGLVGSAVNAVIGKIVWRLSPILYLTLFCESISFSYNILYCWILFLLCETSGETCNSLLCGRSKCLPSKPYRIE